MKKTYNTPQTRTVAMQPEKIVCDSGSQKSLRVGESYSEGSYIGD